MMDARSIAKAAARRRRKNHLTGRTPASKEDAMDNAIFPHHPALWKRIVAKAWADELYKKRLLADPVAVMREEGAPVCEGMQVSVVENTASQAWLVLPRQPETEPAVTEDAGRVAGQGGGFFQAVRAM
jgi:hypothetical protein